MQAMAPPSPERLRALIDALESGLLERGAAVRLALLAALGGQHVLLIGPPGTAKSELARRLHRAFAGAPYFERLLTRFTVPEELFGPLSLAALEQDRYERLTEGYLPTAGIAFLDEVFKANSAILNALLTLLNEREFDNGCERRPVPLISVVGATNEVPQEEGLRAFHDRFLVRVPIAPVSEARFAQLLRLRPEPVTPPAPLQANELHALRTAAAEVDLPEATLAWLHAARARCAALPAAVSDRRWRQVIGLLQLQAASEGRDQIDPADLWLLPHVLSTEPAQVEPLTAWFIDEVMASPVPERSWVERAVEAFEKQCEIEAQARQDDDGSAGKLALARSLGGSTAEPGMARLLSARLEDRLQRRYSPVHVAARVAQVDELLQRLVAEQQQLQQAADAVVHQLAARLWWPPTLVDTVCARRRAAVDLTRGLVERLHAVRDAFARLPVDDTLSGEAPPPVALQA